MNLRESENQTTLPGRYFDLLAAGLRPVEERLTAEPDADLAAWEAGPRGRHFPSVILAAAVLYARPHPSNPAYGDRRWLDLACKIGDLLARENEQGRFTARLDHHRDTYMWLDAYRLLEQELGDER